MDERVIRHLLRIGGVTRVDSNGVLTTGINVRNPTKCEEDYHIHKAELSCHGKYCEIRIGDRALIIIPSEDLKDVLWMDDYRRTNG